MSSLDPTSAIKFKKKDNNFFPHNICVIPELRTLSLPPTELVVKKAFDNSREALVANNAKIKANLEHTKSSKATAKADALAQQAKVEEMRAQLVQEEALVIRQSVQAEKPK